MAEGGVFEESIKNSMKEKMEAMLDEKSELPVVNNPKVIAIIKERIEEGETQWDLLKKMVDGSLTERFINVISQMGDKDFARNYLKLLEHFKPKVTRMEGGELEQQDTTINIQTVIVNADGEKEVILIDEIQEDES